MSRHHTWAYPGMASSSQIIKGLIDFSYTVHYIKGCHLAAFNIVYKTSVFVMI